MGAHEVPLFLLEYQGISILRCLLTGVKLDGKSIWKIHMDFFFFENPFFLNLF